MTVLPIRLLGDPVLRTPAEVGHRLRQAAARPGRRPDRLDAVGARRRAWPRRSSGSACGCSPIHIDDAQSGHLINPTLHFPTDDEQDGPEGCLSIPGVSVDCRRKLHVVAHGQNMYGDPILVEGTALLARCVQHETDHLDGVLFLDRLDTEAKREAMRAIRESDWWGAGGQSACRPFKASPHPSGSALR